MPPRRPCQSCQTLFSNCALGGTYYVWLLSPFGCCSSEHRIRRSSWAYSCTLGRHSNQVSKINNLTDYENLTDNTHFAWKNAVTECCAQLKRSNAATCPSVQVAQKDSFLLVPRTVVTTVLLLFLSPAMEAPPAFYGCFGT